MHKFTCPFSLVSSHYVHSVAYRGRNSAKLKVPCEFNAPLGLSKTKVTIEARGEGYNATVYSEELRSEREQLRFLTELFDVLSVLVAEKERSPEHGTVAIESDWFEFVSEAFGDNGIDGSRVRIRDSLQTEVLRTIEINAEFMARARWLSVATFYFDGLKAGLKTSKFFHWFLVLEFVEGSEKYAKMFQEKLFDGSERVALEKFARTLSSDNARSSVLALKSKTRLGRSRKLVQILASIGITRVLRSGVSVVIDEKMIMRLTVGRGALFHSGETFDDAMLWTELFPIASQIVMTLLANPDCLS